MLPLIVFIVADALFGNIAGLIIAIVFGVLEFIYSYLKERSIDKFILMDIGLIFMLGIISIFFNNPIFFKLKPAIIELFICVIIGISLFSPLNIIQLMTKRYMKNIEFDPYTQKKMHKGLVIVFWLFFIHTILIVISAVFMSHAAWGFVSGGLFYIIFIGYLVFEYTKNKIKKNQWKEKFKDEEWFDIVKENGNKIGIAPRSICHSGQPGYLHPVIHLHVLDFKDHIVLQKRSINKQIQPGKWDTAVGGHISAGETIEQALLREAQEEIGLSEFKANFIKKYVWKTKIEEELVFMFYAKSNCKLIPQKEEVDEIKSWRIKNIKNKLDKGIFTPNFVFEFDTLQKVLFKNT